MIEPFIVDHEHTLADVTRAPAGAVALGLPYSSTMWALRGVSVLGTSFPLLDAMMVEVDTTGTTVGEFLNAKLQLLVAYGAVALDPVALRLKPWPEKWRVDAQKVGMDDEDRFVWTDGDAGDLSAIPITQLAQCR